MIGRAYRNEDFVPGFRFLTSGWGQPLFNPFGASAKRVDLLHEVTFRFRNDFETRDHLGGIHSGKVRNHEPPYLGKDVRKMERRIAWADPLPHATFDGMQPLADALLHSGSRNRPYLLLCKSIDSAGDATCQLINTAQNGGATRGQRINERIPGHAVGNAFFNDELVIVAAGTDKPVLVLDGDQKLYSPKPGDFFLAMDVTTSADATPTIIAANLMQIQSGMDSAQIGDWMPAPIVRPTRHFDTNLDLSTREDLQIEMDRAAAKCERDEIIVIAVPTPDGKIHNASLSATGIKLHEVDTLDDDLWSDVFEPGVWIGSDIAWHDCQEDGAEWSASWARATATDLERHGLSSTAIAADWAEYAETCMSPEAIDAIIAEGVAAEAAKDKTEQASEK